MARATIYLDSSVPSALLDARDPIRQKETRDFWSTLGNYEPHVSTLVADELGRPGRGGATRPAELVALIQSFKMLNLTDEVRDLADKYVAAAVLPLKHRADAVHLACASVHGVEFVVSWNFRHMVRVKTRKLVNAVNALNRYGPVEIVAPVELDLPDTEPVE